MSRYLQRFKTLPERFWEKVDKRGPDDCWVWTASTDVFGYGCFCESTSRRNRKAHRVAYRLAYGEIPPGLSVLHSCDNPGCVNPAHLRAGTQKDNIADREARGRCVYAVGTRHGQSKLTELQVQKIRIIGNTLSQKRIAEIMGVNQSAISYVLSGKTWKHLTSTKQALA